MFSIPGELNIHPQCCDPGGLGSEALDAGAREAAAGLLWTERSELREIAGADVFVDVIAPAPRLLILGAVDYAAALCRLARASGWRPYVCDPRTALRPGPASPRPRR